MKEEIKGVSVEQKTSSQRTQTKIPRGDKIYQSLLQEFYLLWPKAACRIRLGAWWHVTWFLCKHWLHFIPTCAQQNTPRKNPGQESRTDLHFIWFREKEMGSGVVTAALASEKRVAGLTDIFGHRFWSQKHWIQDSFLPFIEQITTMLTRAILRINDIVLGKWLIHQKIIYKC